MATWFLGRFKAAIITTSIIIIPNYGLEISLV